jgi:hypothetical protein
MPPSPRNGAAAPRDPAVVRQDVQRLFERGVRDLRAATDLALQAPGTRHLAIAPEPRQQTLAFESPALPPRAPLLSSLNPTASRLSPYERRDGVQMIKQSFRASEAFDRLWRKLDGALPRHISKHVWVEQVLTNAIRKQLQQEDDLQAAE